VPSEKGHTADKPDFLPHDDSLVDRGFSYLQYVFYYLSE
jgi:hypothetical protein